MNPHGAQLAEMLKNIEGGQDVLDAMERAPVETEASQKIREEGDVIHLENAGVIRRGSHKLPANFWDLPRPDDPKNSVRRALGEDRK